MHLDVQTPETISHNEVIYAIRTVHQNQTQLNLMADQKANILLGLLMIFMTLVISKSIGLDVASFPLVHLAAFTLFICLLSIAALLAIMVLAPKLVPNRKKADIKDIRNPFFFGFFTGYSEDEFLDHMLTELHIAGNARALLLKDIYQNGQVLQRKYSLLRRAYFAAALAVLSPLFTLLVDSLIR